MGEPSGSREFTPSFENLHVDEVSKLGQPEIREEERSEPQAELPKSKAQKSAEVAVAVGAAHIDANGFTRLRAGGVVMVDEDQVPVEMRHNIELLLNKGVSGGVDLRDVRNEIYAALLQHPDAKESFVELLKRAQENAQKAKEGLEQKGQASQNPTFSLEPLISKLETIIQLQGLFGDTPSIDIPISPVSETTPDSMLTDTASPPEFTKPIAHHDFSETDTRDYYELPGIISNKLLSGQDMTFSYKSGNDAATYQFKENTLSAESPSQETDKLITRIMEALQQGLVRPLVEIKVNQLTFKFSDREKVVKTRQS